MSRDLARSGSKSFSLVVPDTTEAFDSLPVPGRSSKCRPETSCAPKASDQNQSHYSAIRRQPFTQLRDGLNHLPAGAFQTFVRHGIQMLRFYRLELRPRIPAAH